MSTFQRQLFLDRIVSLWPAYGIDPVRPATKVVEDAMDRLSHPAHRHQAAGNPIRRTS
jgi:hypothetical protein